VLRSPDPVALRPGGPGALADPPSPERRAADGGSLARVTDAARLAALRESALLASEAEEAFDRLTRLASKLLGVPVSLLTLIDADRQVFKSAIGLPEPVATTRQTPLSYALCQYVVADDAPVTIDDTRAHPRLREHLAVTELGVGAYCGVPLRTPEGQVLGSLCAIDLVARVWTPEDLAALSDLASVATAEVELRARTREAGRRAAALAAAEAKGAILANMSHEIRTPLTSISGYLDLVLDEEAGVVSDDQRELLGIAKRNADRLTGLLDDLLDISQLEAGAISLRRAAVDLAAATRAVADGFRAQIAAKDQELVVELDAALAPVWADPQRLTQILTVLLSNAHKYTPAGGRITVTATPGSDAVRVTVRDTGIGLTAAEQTRLFEPFYRAKNRATEEIGGAGLGLAIVRALVERHGGKMEVVSAQGQGAAIGFTLPVARAGAAP
jgi:signal transduction histidine kinase